MRPNPLGNLENDHNCENEWEILVMKFHLVRFYNRTEFCISCHFWGLEDLTMTRLLN